MDFKSQNELWPLINNYMNITSIVNNQIGSFNHFIEHDIQDILLSTEPIVLDLYRANPFDHQGHDQDQDQGYTTEINQSINQRYTVKFGPGVYISKPSVTEFETGEVMDISPNEALIRNITYSSPIHTDVVVQIEHRDSITGNWVLLSETKTIEYLCRIPMMIGAERSTGAEKDAGGYFILKGTDSGSEKVVISQERQANNLIYAFKDRDKKAFSVEVRSQTKMYEFMSTASCFLDSDNRIKVTIQGIKTEIPLVCVFKALGLQGSVTKYLSTVFGLSHVNKWLYKSLEEESIFLDQNYSLAYIGSKANIRDSNLNMEYIGYAKEVLNSTFLKHLNIVQQDLSDRKIYFLGLMVQKLIMLASGQIDEDDRDHYANRRMDTTGVLCSQLFYELMRVMRNDTMKKLRFQLDKDHRTFSVKNALNTDIITDGFIYSLGTGNWALKGVVASRTGVSQALTRLAYSGTVSHLRRVNTPMSRTSKQTGPRMLHNTQFGYFCPAESPEGSGCGLVKALALSCEPSMSYNSLNSKLLGLLYAEIEFNVPKNNDNKKDSEEDLIEFFFNGTILGLVEYHFVEKARKIVKDFKKSSISNKFVSFAYSSDQLDLRKRTVHIFTDGGRVTRPMLTFDATGRELLLKKKDVLKEWSVLLSEGLIEYIDCRESETSMFLMTFEEFDHENSLNTYTHSEIHPALILGSSASRIPFSHHNSSPRNSYGSGMTKQAIGQYIHDHTDRMDSMANTMWYPQKPIACTKTMPWYKGNELTAGVNVIVAIAIYTGYNQEDSIIMSKSAIDRGLFRSTYTRTYSSTEEDARQKFEIPDPKDTIAIQTGSYSKLGSDGVIEPGTFVSANDILIGKTGVLQRSNDPSMKKRDLSVSMKTNDSGIVDKVVVTETIGDLGRSKSVKVRVRNIRTPQMGDKFSATSSQKGTVGMIYNQEDMPFTQDGIVPDIIINPHAIPSRMTIGQLLECLISKVGALDGSTQDATVFNPITVEEIGAELQKYGYQKHGTERFTHGHTGKHMDALIFVGPTFYMRLKHMVADKVHQRSKGALNQLTRQPLSGKKFGGGLRMGEMERDVGLISGLSAFLRDRLFVNSDLYRVHVCESCGLFVPTDASICQRCSQKGIESRIAQVFLPYACKLLFQELQTILITPRLQLE